MPQLNAVSKDRHAKKRWKPYTSYAFAAADAIAPLVAQELPKASLALPLAFAPKDDGFVPVAVQGVMPGRNLFVGTDGEWLAKYIPATYRSYPFVLADTDDGQKVLCLRESDDMLSDTDGEPFFDDEGNPSQHVKDVMTFLSQMATDAQATQRLCALLSKHQLIQPWSITLKTSDADRAVKGLYRIDEAALDALSADAFLELREQSALPVVYCQLLSMLHLPNLAKLANSRTTPQASQHSTADEPDPEFFTNNEIIRFGNGSS